MGTIAGITKKFTSYADGFNNEINKAVKENVDIIRELQLDQFASGLDNIGKPLYPNYDNDPYFAEKASRMNARQKVKTTAKTLSDAYKKWKWDIRPQAQLVPFPQRSISMPNLYINGTFWSTVYAKAVKDGWEIGGTWEATSEMEAKYRTLFGLSPESKNYFINNILIPALNNYMKNKLK